jgi:hypothetical protein
MTKAQIPPPHPKAQGPRKGEDRLGEISANGLRPALVQTIKVSMNNTSELTV